MTTSTFARLRSDTVRGRTAIAPDNGLAERYIRVMIAHGLGDIQTAKIGMEPLPESELKVLLEDVAEGSQIIANAYRKHWDKDETRAVKSSPETIARNVKMCTLRKNGRTVEQISKRFHIKSDTVEKVIREENRWRALLAELEVKRTTYRIRR